MTTTIRPEDILGPILDYQPTLLELGVEERNLLHPSSMAKDLPARTETEANMALDESVSYTERRLVRLRMLKLIRQERAQNSSWWRKILGF